MPAGTTTVIEGKSYCNVDDINRIPDFHSNHNLGNHALVSQQTYYFHYSS